MLNSLLFMDITCTNINLDMNPFVYSIIHKKKTKNKKKKQGMKNTDTISDADSQSLN